MWEQRIAIVSTLAFVRNSDFATAISLAEKHLNHPHNLIHKATGWVLREIGKKDITTLRAFLDAHAPQMPRTALRYAIEKLPQDERKKYLMMK